MNSTKKNDSTDSLHSGLKTAKSPKVGVIITHHNYSEHLDGAINSVLSQTYQDFECVVVDDRSDEFHLERLRSITQDKDRAINVVFNSEKLGQVRSFYRGVSEIQADFYCLLDPDDRYTPSFIERMVEVHLNPVAYVPFVCCDQMFLVDDRIVTGTRGLNAKVEYQRNYSVPLEDGRSEGSLYIYPPSAGYWYWSSSSSLMFRAGCIDLLKPPDGFPHVKRQADGYLGYGASMLGGGIVLDEALVYRCLHSQNSWMSSSVVSSFARQRKRSVNADRNSNLELLSLKSILANGGGYLLKKPVLRRAIKKSAKVGDAKRLRATYGEVRHAISHLDLFYLRWAAIRTWAKG